MNLERTNNRLSQYRIGCEYWPDLDEMFPGENFFLGAMPIRRPCKDGTIKTGYTSLCFNPNDYKLLKAKVMNKPVYKRR